MKVEKMHLVWFSATSTTKRITELVADQFAAVSVVKHDITKCILKKDIQIEANDLLVVGMPVYTGRIPVIAVDALKKFKGSNTPAIIINVYGNRNYDDALLELKDIVQTCGFTIISAAAFIAQHSIFPTVGTSRPDEKDKSAIEIFGRRSAELLLSFEKVNNLCDINIKGNHPYRKSSKVPLTPKGDKKCNKCGICVKLCPMDAIQALNPRNTISTKCIACARCIVACPQHSRHFGGLLYKFARWRFTKANIIRKEPEMVYYK